MGMAFSKEQIIKAQNADTISFLGEFCGFTFKNAGKYYRCIEHDSLVICPDRKGFVWNSFDVKGGDAIDFLIKIYGKTFVEAVSIILQSNCEFIPYISSVHDERPVKSQEKQAFVLPASNCKEKNPSKGTLSYSCRQLYAYLVQTRCIAQAVVNDFIAEKKIYQGNNKHGVFVGYDEQGIARFATTRSLLSSPVYRYRGEVRGSDKRYAFNQIGTDLTTVYVFESPIDLMSHCTIVNLKANSKTAYKEQTRLSLCGTSDYALVAFIQRYPSVRRIEFRLDNDAAGHKATEEYLAKYSKLGYEVNAVFSKRKDINDDLCSYIQARRKENREKQEKKQKSE